MILSLVSTLAVNVSGSLKSDVTIILTSLIERAESGLMLIFKVENDPSCNLEMFSRVRPLLNEIPKSDLISIFILFNTMPVPNMEELMFPRHNKDCVCEFPLYKIILPLFLILEFSVTSINRFLLSNTDFSLSRCPVVRIKCSDTELAFLADAFNSNSTLEDGKSLKEVALIDTKYLLSFTLLIFILETWEIRFKPSRF